MIVENEEQYEKALKMIERLMACPKPEDDAFLMMLAENVEKYELKHYPIDPPVWE